MHIAFIGYGQVGGALADQLQRAGHHVTLAAADQGSVSVSKALARNPLLQVAAPLEAVAAADIVFLATPFEANEAALTPVRHALAGKVLVDCTNPVGPGISHGLGSRESGTEQIQRLLPDAQLVKAFTIYGFENFEDNRFPAYAVKPVMLYCGNSASAKHTVATLITQLGWEPLDVGSAAQALHLEHMTLLWVRMVRVEGHSPHLVWAALQR